MQQEDFNARLEAAIGKRKRSTRVVFLAVQGVMWLVFSVIVLMMLLNAPELGALGEQASGALIGALIMLQTGWLMGIFFQLISVLMDYNIGDKRLRSEVLLHEFGAELAEATAMLAEKRKHTSRLAEDTLAEDEEVVLGADGELVNVKRR